MTNLLTIAQADAVYFAARKMGYYGIFSEIRRRGGDHRRVKFWGQKGAYDLQRAFAKRHINVTVLDWPGYHSRRIISLEMRVPTDWSAKGAVDRLMRKG